MHNLLIDSLIRARGRDGVVERLSLPELYAALVADCVMAFPALRPHQRHAWHAFLAQLAVIALHRAGSGEPPQSPGEWRGLLRGLTPDFPEDEPWTLVVDDPTRPGFMQCPAPDGLADYGSWKRTPDDLDILVTSKNHDVKQGVAASAAAEDWVLALIDLQTMGGYFGAGNYPIARMNGGYSARASVGLTPSAGGPGAHLCSDIARMLARRDTLLNEYADYFHGDLALLWLAPWDGRTSLDLRDLDPYFIEICRRVRLIHSAGAIAARSGASRAPRIQAKAAGGNLGDFWTPVRVADGTALHVTAAGFRYDRLVSLILDQRTYRHPPAMDVAGQPGERWRLVLRGVAGGQGKTDGYHERTDIAFSAATARGFARRERHDQLAKVAEDQMAETDEVMKALRFGIAVAASGGKSAAELGKSDRAHAHTYARRLDAAVDARFFAALEDRFGADDEIARRSHRAAFARYLIDAAWRLLREAIETVPCPAIHRPRARARAESAYWGRLRRARSVFSDQPEIFAARESEHAA